MTGRSSVRVHVVLQILLATWVLWVANAWAFRHSWRIDLTSDHRYSVPAETSEFLISLPKRVDVVIPYSFGASALDRIQARVLAQAIRTLEEFERINPDFHIDTEIHVGRDPLRWQQLREERAIEQLNCVHLFSGDRRELVAIGDLAEIFVGDDGPVLRRERVPEALFDALVRVVRNEDAPLVLFSTGHGELALDDTRQGVGIGPWVRDLRERGVTLESIDIARGERIPHDVTALAVIAGSIESTVPFEPFGADECAEVERFVAQGGHLLLLLPFQGSSGLESLAAARGIEPLDGLVCSSLRTREGGLGTVQAGVFAVDHPVTARFRFGEDVVELNSFRPLMVADGAVSLVSCSDSTWAEQVPLDGIRGTDEPSGPFALVAAAEGEGGRMVVLGSWTPVLEIFYRGQTRRLLLNIGDWLTKRDGIPAGVGRVDPGNRVVLTPGVRSAFFWTSVFTLPGSVLVLGVVVWWVRRRSS